MNQTLQKLLLAIANAIIPPLISFVAKKVREAIMADDEERIAKLENAAKKAEERLLELQREIDKKKTLQEGPHVSTTGRKFAGSHNEHFIDK